jgi:hypothetical protein
VGVDSRALDGGWTWAARIRRHGTVSGRLASLGEQAVGALLEEAAAARVGIGGQTAVLAVEGTPVFVKRVPLTDLERRPEHVRSTANLFGLPGFYQYGIGSAGFGAWRELAAHLCTTDWVLRGSHPGFPLLYHWRVVSQAPAGIEPTELERWVARWDGSPAVRARLTAIAQSSAAVVLFMEYLPYTVDSWLTERAAAGSTAAARAFAMVDRDLRAGARLMQSRRLWHFDAHFHNLLTDGHRVYFADFGLAASSRFAVGAAERAFLRRHANYDRCYMASHLALWLVSTLLGIPWADARTYIRDGLPDRRYDDLPPAAARIVARHAPVVAVMSAFFSRLQTVSKSTPYPAEELHDALHR